MIILNEDVIESKINNCFWSPCLVDIIVGIQYFCSGYETFRTKFRSVFNISFNSTEVNISPVLLRLKYVVR